MSTVRLPRNFLHGVVSMTVWLLSLCLLSDLVESTLSITGFCKGPGTRMLQLEHK